MGGIIGMEKLGQIYEGKAKKVYNTDDPDIVLVDYKDDATAFNGLKKGTIVGKGIVNNRVSNHMFRMLEEKGIPTHYVEQISERETLVKKVEIVQVEVIVRNIAAGSLSKRLGLPEGTKLPVTVLEYCYKSDELGDPMINDYHIAALGLATREEMDEIAKYSLQINDIMTAYLKQFGIELIDFKLEFGRFHGQIILADEISPDTCRFWDTKTGEKLDKDRFRRDLGHVEDAYQEILKRLMGE
jgi:phosphoribosylaminoimidazole-succinocarboxamide synthase